MEFRKHTASFKRRIWEDRPVSLPPELEAAKAFLTAIADAPRTAPKAVRLVPVGVLQRVRVASDSKS